MNIENIINKYNYPEDLASFLRKLYPEFINYFGLDKEPIIYEALLNTEIIIGDVYSTLKKYDMLEKDTSTVSNADLKRSAGVYQSIPLIEYQNNSFNITNVKRIVVVYKDNNSFNKGTLIHELGHLIKSYYNEFKIEGDILTTKSGLIENTYHLSLNDGVITKNLIKEESIGLEEGLNSILEEEIAQKIVDPNYKSGYGLLSDLTKILLTPESLKSAILNTEIMDEKSNIIKLMDEVFIKDSFNRFDNIFDKVYRLTLKRFSEVFDQNKYKLTIEELQKVIADEFNPLIKEIKNQNNIRKEM